VAEDLIFKRISTGASNDIKQATALANRMVRIFGMSDNLAPLSYENHDDNIFIGREMTQAKAYSEETAKKIDAEVALIIDRAYQSAKKCLKDNIDILHALTDLLIEKETVLGPELDELIATMRPDFDFFGKKNVYTQPQQAAEPEDQEKPKENDKNSTNSVDENENSDNKDSDEVDNQTSDDQEKGKSE